MKTFTTVVANLVIGPLVSALTFNTLEAQSVLEPSKTSFPSMQFGGQVRYRAELDGRFFNANAKPLFINMLRSSIHLRASLTEDISAFVQVQDSRNFGEEQDGAWRGTLDGMADNLDMHQAWILWNNFLAPGLSLKLGRMTFATNNERLVGVLDWHNVGRVYDGATLTYSTPDKWQIRAFGFVLGNDELLMTAAGRQNPQALTGIDLTIPGQQALNVFLYHDWIDRKNVRPLTFQGDTTTTRRFTGGLYVKNTIEGWDYEADAMYQFGSKQDVPTLGQLSSIQAYLLGVYIGRRFSVGNGQTATIGIGADMYSGDNLATPTISEGFDHLTTTIHKFYGYMDFLPFAILPVAGLRRAPAVTTYGLIDPYIRLTHQPDAKTELYVAGHYFLSERPIVLIGRSLNSLGMEIDATATYKISPLVSAQCGASVLLPGEAMRETNPSRGLGRDAAYWGYVMLTANF